MASDDDESRTAAVRLFAQWEDDPTECRFAADVTVDCETGSICGDWPIFGATEHDGAQPRPFLIDASGRFHFGAADRDWTTNLRNVRIAVGRRFQIWWTPEESGAYEVVKVAVLGRKGVRLRFLSTLSDT